MKTWSKETINNLDEYTKNALVLGGKAHEALEVIKAGEANDYLAGQSTLQAMKERADLASIVFDAVINGTESFEEENIGADLAYLLGAIVKNTLIEWEEKNMPALHDVLAKEFEKEHPVWSHIAIFKEDKGEKAS